MIHFLKLSTPIILSMMVHYLIPITDLLMIAHLGMISVAAVSISIDLSIVFSIFPAGVAYGIQPFIEKLNHQTIHENTKWFFNSLFINVLGSIIFAGFLLCMIHWLPYLKQDTQAVEMVPYYMPWLACSIFPTMVYNTFCRYLEGLGHTKPIFIVTMIGLIANIILNYLFIYVNIGHFTNGLVGAGIATLCSRFMMAIALMPYVWKRLETDSKHLLILSYFDRQYIKKLLTLGIPIGSQLFLEFFFFSFTGLIVGNLGALYKGANAILDNIISLPIGISWGFSLAASTLVKQTRCFNHKEKKQSIWIYYGTTGMVMLVLAFFIVRYSFFIFTVCYQGSATDYSMIASSIPLAILLIFADGFYTISLGLLRGLKDTFFPFLIATLSNWLIGIPLCYVLIKVINLGIPSVWISKIMAFLMSGSILFVRFLKKYNKKNICS
ncbi:MULTISPECIES: MATE family efflux transporter [Candidatus Cardinium]|uniref:MATE family efflux transporter n=1 Tax=Candidatus Cardinium TaxID=273135 RepID=UPI001FAB1FB0|nr:MULTISPECIES: MATE family efflux transporter [Cardinium]